MIKHGPVDVVVLAAGEPSFDGGVLAELERQAESGTIRVLDAMILLKDEKGEVFSLDLEDLPPEDAAKVGFIDTGTRGLFDSEDAATLIEGMVPGSAVIASGDRAYLGAGSGEHPLAGRCGCRVELPRAGACCRRGICLARCRLKEGD